jgi:putative ABC transport system ATP-binding protein
MGAQSITSRSLLRASGSGKSTLLNILGGLDRASSGDVKFRHSSLTAMDDSALTQFRRKHVGSSSNSTISFRASRRARMLSSSARLRMSRPRRLKRWCASAREAEMTGSRLREIKNR